MSKWIGKRVFYTCDYCGKFFTINKKTVSNEKGVFCSKECAESNLKELS